MHNLDSRDFIRAYIDHSNIHAYYLFQKPILSITTARCEKNKTYVYTLFGETRAKQAAAKHIT